MLNSCWQAPAAPPALQHAAVACVTLFRTCLGPLRDSGGECSENSDRASPPSSLAIPGDSMVLQTIANGEDRAASACVVDLQIRRTT